MHRDSRAKIRKNRGTRFGGIGRTLGAPNPVPFLNEC